VHQCTDFFSLHHFFQITHCVHVKNDDGQVILFAHAGGSEVHHFQTALQHFVVGDVVELHGCRVLLRVGGVDAVHTGTFQHDIRLNLDAAQTGTGIGSEERRKQLAKQCKGEGETAKVSVRNARRDAIDALKKSVKDGLAEDAQKGGEEKLQKIHDKFIKQIDDMLAAKDKEIMTV
jgi:hypothetical protein